MVDNLGSLARDYDEGRINRRQLLSALAVAAATSTTVAGTETTPSSKTAPDNKSAFVTPLGLSFSLKTPTTAVEPFDYGNGCEVRTPALAR